MRDVLTRVEGTLGRITLNRPGALNALTLGMTQVMYTALLKWETDPGITLVAIDGAGHRGLCAGGDVREIYNYIKAGDLNTPARFFAEEYRLNYLISRYSKPYIAFMDGVVMGGGVGVAAHGSHRIVTERSTLAMPEARIGFVPDVGGTYLLGIAPNEFGTHLALTARHIGAEDSILCGLADLYVESNRLDSLTHDLRTCASIHSLDRILATYATAPTGGMLSSQRIWISESYRFDTVERIISELAKRPEEDAHRAAEEILRNSPTSLKIALRALRNASIAKNLRTSLRQEYRTSLRLLRGSDFIEGVRAAIVDKDRTPRWQPAQLEQVSLEQVERFFTATSDSESDTMLSETQGHLSPYTLQFDLDEP